MGYNDIRAIFCIEDLPYIGNFILRVGKPDLYRSVVVALFYGFQGVSGRKRNAVRQTDKIPIQILEKISPVFWSLATCR